MLNPQTDEGPRVTPSIADRFFNYDAPQVREETGEFRFLADRPDSDWATLVQRTETLRYNAGQTIIAAGDRDQALYLLTKGVVGVVLPGMQSAFKEIDAPSVVGEVSFIDGGPRSVSLVALTECELLRMGIEAFEVLSAHHPELGRAILLDLARILAARLRIATGLIARS
jgi:CRP/FNR family transcriptional regulator, cyclic AMP receptor protein